MALNARLVDSALVEEARIQHGSVTSRSPGVKSGIAAWTNQTELSDGSSDGAFGYGVPTIHLAHVGPDMSTYPKRSSTEYHYGAHRFVSSCEGE